MATVEDVLAAMEQRIASGRAFRRATPIPYATLTALLAVVKAAQARLNAGHNDGCMWVFDAERCDAKMDHSDHRPCDCGHDAVEKALAALTRPPQGAGG